MPPLRIVPFFFYGTLMAGTDTPMARWTAQRAVSCEAASARGRLVAVAAGSTFYPALLRSGPGQRVRGTVCRLCLSVQDLERLDRYEGAAYERAALVARTESGRAVTAQAYFWIGRPPPRSPRIEGGDFLDWLHARRRPVFAGDH